MSEKPDVEEPIFGRTMVNGTEYDRVLDLESPNGRSTFGLSRAECLALAQLLESGLDATEVPEDFEKRAEDIIRTLRWTKTVEECAEEVQREERARGGIA